MDKKKTILIAAIVGVHCISGSEHLTGDWNGARKQAHEAGIDFSASYANELMGNPIGGRSHGFTNAGELNTAMTLDLEKIANIFGCSLYNSFSWSSGSSLSAKHIDNAFPVQMLYNGETYKLVELYLEESIFDHCLNIRAGRLCAGNDFLASPIYLRYVTSAINSNPISAIYNAFFSTYPFATWGANIDFHIHSFLFKFGVYNNNPKIWKNKYHGVNLTFHSQQGAMWISEWTYLLNQEPHRRGLSGNYTIGGYYVTGQTAEFKTGAACHNYGFYFLFDQSLYRNQKAKTDQNLTAWGAILYAPPGRNEFPLFFSAGLVYQGVWPSRPKDALCFAAAYGHYSADLRQTELHNKKRAVFGPYGTQPQSSEADIEINYWFQANSWLALTPVMQYIIHPKGYGTTPNALVMGLQITIDI
jgi:porin